MKDCYYDLGLHFILLDDSSQSYILKLRDRLHINRPKSALLYLTRADPEFFSHGGRGTHRSGA